jgi:6-phosphogluconolactonase
MSMRSLAALACAAVALLATAAGASAAERVYVGDASNNLYAFDRNDATGALTPMAGSPFTSGNLQDGIVATADGSRLYVTGHNSESVFGFTAPPAGGPSLSALPGSPFAAGGQPLLPTLAAGERFLYTPLDIPDVGPGHLTGFRVSRETGALRPLPSFPLTEQTPFAALADPSGQFVAVSDGDGGGTGFIAVYRIDRATGALTEVPSSPTSTGRNPGFMVFSPNGKFLYVGDTSGSNDTVRGFALDAATGELTEVPGSPFPSGLGAVAGLDVTPDGRFLYAATNDEAGHVDNGVSQFSIGSDGSLTPLSPATVGAGPFPGQIKVSDDGRFAYMDDGFNLRAYSVGSAGQLTELPGSPYAVSTTQTIGLAVAPVPPAPPAPPDTSHTRSDGPVPPRTGTPPLPTQPVTPSPTVTSGVLKLLGTHVLRESRGRVSFKVECGDQACPARVSLRARLGRKLRTIASSRLDLQAGETKTVRLRLSSPSRRYLARHDRVSATLALGSTSTRVRLT